MSPLHLPPNLLQDAPVPPLVLSADDIYLLETMHVRVHNNQNDQTHARVYHSKKNVILFKAMSTILPDKSLIIKMIPGHWMVNGYLNTGATYIVCYNLNPDMTIDLIKGYLPRVRFSHNSRLEGVFFVPYDQRVPCDDGRREALVEVHMP
ncbi:unnamed protein product, partial [Didymodactylos carnosus]